MPPVHVLVAFGTRPEAVKMAPVIAALHRRANEFRVTTAVTAQHREMLDQVMMVFGLTAQHDLDLMQPGQTLPALTARVLTHITPILERERPDLVLVQGDTTTVLSVSLAAFYLQIPVGHVEAGLRTPQRYDPFPEEMNRRLTSRLASMHFAPTAWARDNLIAEGLPPEDVHITGNTVIDALRSVMTRHLPDPPDLPSADLAGRRLVLVTAHRRENLGEPLESLCLAFRDIVDSHDDVLLVYAMHRNPKVRETARGVLGDHPRVRLIEPPDYLAFVGLMKRATLILTDSGGVQEEAPALGKPVLVLRRTTERPEGVTAGTARLVGTERQAVAQAASQLLDEPAAYDAMAHAVNPYGDGLASERILAAILHHLRGAARPADFAPEGQGL